MVQITYGFPRPLPIQDPTLDFATFSNEDIDFNANLSTGLAAVHNTSLPYPASIDFEDESMVLHALEFIRTVDLAGQFSALTFHILRADLSMLDKRYSTGFRGSGGDNDDEAHKSKFATNIFFGHLGGTLIGAARSLPSEWARTDNNYDAIYYPPYPLDLVTPLYMNLINQSFIVTLATGVAAGADFTVFEQISLRAWYTKRELSGTEKTMRAFINRLLFIET